MSETLNGRKLRGFFAQSFVNYGGKGRNLLIGEPRPPVESVPEAPGIYSRSVAGFI
jgi:hypothetical protein